MFPLPVVPPVPAVASVSLTDHMVDAGNATGYTFSGRAIGAAAADRKVVISVAIGNNAPAVTVSTLKLNSGAITATLVKALQINSESRLEIWQAVVTTGTTASIEITLNGTAQRIGVQVWAIRGAASAAADTGESTANPMTDTLSVAAGGVAVGVAITLGNTATHTWAGLTESNNEEVMETVTKHSGADAAFVAAQSGLSVTVTSSNPASGDGMIFAAWAPA